MTIGERIRQRRIELGMTQDELAKKAGYQSSSSINKLESARVLPSRKIELMAKALECSPAYLMGWSEEEERANDILAHIVRLSDDELRMVKAFNSADDYTKRMVMYMLKLQDITHK